LKLEACEYAENYISGLDTSSLRGLLF